MCGIVGRFNFNGKSVETEQLQEMMAAIKHRGPDDENIFIENQLGLGHVRLSIIDLSEMGQQPMVSATHNSLIIFNGEIYNYLELKKELEPHYKFRTKTDTEVILAAYEHWGQGCLKRFNGDWAFVIFDKRNNQIFGARDRYGIKPFYYVKDNNSFIFASELKALIKVIKPKVNRGLVYDYLQYNRTDHTNDTFFEGIHKLPPGASFTITNNSFKIEQWYHLPEMLDTNLDKGVEENAKRFKELFTDSIRLRLRSDVPVGVCLSGGLDSSSIVSTLIESFNNSSVNTFSAIYEGSEQADESRFIRLYQSQLSNMHFISPNGQTFYDDFQAFILAQAEPVASIGPYAQFKVMELAKKHVKVTLDGQGADEYLAGYHYFFGAYFKELLYNFNFPRLLSETSYYWNNHRSSTAFKYWIYYCLPAGLKSNVSKSVYGNINDQFFKEFNSQTTIQNNLYNPRTLNQSLIQHFQYKLQHLLKWEDHNAMHFSIEPRVPFLDHRIVEFMLSLKPENAIFKGQTKYVLRQSMKDILPDQIMNRKDKKGFSTPSDDWFREKKFVVLINDIISSESFREQGFFDPVKCRKSFDRHLNGVENNTKDIWKWINMHFWLKNFIE